MRSFFLSLALLLFVGSCTSKKEATETEVYTFLNICFEDYYKNYDIEISDSLQLFEKQLIKEGHLLDSTSKSYKMLLKSLKRNTYFEKPLDFNSFDKVLLYKNPSDLTYCASTVFNIDSVTVSNTHFFKITEKVKEELSTQESISIHDLFRMYNVELSEEELQLPFIKQSLQLLLYRWYYKSKNTYLKEGTMEQ